MSLIASSRARSLLGAGLAVGALLTATEVQADPHSGVDAALFRPAIDTTGVFSLEGARLMPKRDLSWKMLLGFAQKPLEAAVPGIGEGADNTGDDVVLDYLMTIDIGFAFQLTSRLALGFDAAVYRTNTGDGYGERGRYRPEGNTPSTGLISLRPLSSFDPSGGFEPQGLSGPLDVRLVAKYQAWTNENMAVTLMGAAGVPFGEDEMFLGDRNFVLEPRLLFDYRLDRVKSTKLVANLGARIRERTVLEAFDSANQMEEEAVVVLDVGSEIIAGVGFVYEVSNVIQLGAEAVGFVPLPSAVSFGDCRRHDGRACSTIDGEDYFADGKAGDLAAYVNVGAGYRISPHAMINLLGGLGVLGARADDFRVAAGVTWSPQPKGVAELGRGDRDGDGIPDVSDSCMEDAEDKDSYQDDDGCPDVDNDGDGVVDANDSCTDEPEDRDGFEDDDGCPERDNDGDGITDVADRCPDGQEDVDGFEDDDGCPDEDNDGDGFPDAGDRCPNDAETVNGVDDDDGCPDTRTQTGPEEAADRINLRGNKIEFSGKTTLTGASKTILGQVATLIRDRGLTIRVEVHVPLGTKKKDSKSITRQKAKDRDLAQQRAQVILDYLVAQGVPLSQVQAVGLGADRPLGNNPATDPLNERVDFIKSQQRNP